MATIIEGVKTCVLGRQRLFSPSVPAEAGCLFAVAASVHVFISGESLHCFLVGWCTNKSYVIATSDLWLFFHASNLLPSLPTPLPYTNLTVTFSPQLQCQRNLQYQLFLCQFALKYSWEGSYEALTANYWLTQCLYLVNWTTRLPSSCFK